MKEKQNLLSKAFANIKKCDAIIEKLESKGVDVSKSKRLVSEIEQELHDLSGRYRARYSLETVEDALEITEFYLESLAKGGSIL